MHRIFYHDKVLLLNEEIAAGTPSAVNLEFENAETFRYALRILDEQKDVTKVNITFSDSSVLLEKMFKAFRKIEAAGGLVWNPKGEMLLIFRNGKWDIPKGKLKRGEDIQEGALREVEEECNVKGLKITGEYQSTYHLYEMKGKKVVKKTFWYEMSCPENQELIPQTEEGITEVRWFRREEMEEVLENTYSSVREVLLEAVKVIQ
jgi:ADP-ribose pyrophosphatase YjhB (NUDIX family)